MLTTGKLIGGIIVVAVVAYLVFMFDIPYSGKVTDFVSCVAAGNPVMESYPRQCRDKDGNLYVEDIEQPAVNDMIVISTPASDALVSSPVRVSGQARGGWYFEASFPVSVYDANGTMIGRAPVQAEGDWMTSEFVPFSGDVSFTAPSTATGFIRFTKDNPSGLPENDASVDVPVRFGAGAATGTPATAACVISGCSSQICSDTEMMSTCEFRPQYACYKTAVCERQATGQCGWTQTPQLAACLANPPQE